MRCLWEYMLNVIFLSVTTQTVVSSLPPSLPHSLPSKEHAPDAGTGFDKEQGVPADVSKHEVLGEQVNQLPPGGPLRFLPVRL